MGLPFALSLAAAAEESVRARSMPRISCTRAVAASSTGCTLSCTVSRTLCTFSCSGSCDVRIAESSWIVTERWVEISLNDAWRAAGRLAVDA